MGSSNPYTNILTNIQGAPIYILNIDPNKIISYLEPVSYTHLDVYKRQIISMISIIQMIISMIISMISMISMIKSKQNQNRNQNKNKNKNKNKYGN